MVYTPNMNFNGEDSFVFVANDGMVDSEPATISIKIRPVDDSPTARSARVETREDTTLSIILAGDDPDGDTLNYTRCDDLPQCI